MSKQYRKPRCSLVPYATIRDASSGDAEAIGSVLRHYDSYIARLSLRPVRDFSGRTLPARLCGLATARHDAP